MPLTSSEEKIHIDVLCDRGNQEELKSRQWQYRNEIAGFMEPNLVRRLGDYGFSSALIGKETEYKKAAGTYLLKVAIESYNPGSAAARVLVGFGAGACSLKCHYELLDSKGETILSWDDGIGTSQHWKRLPVALNKKAGAKLSQYLAGVSQK
ncbi:uncharacterized protein TOL2_C38310 [Desulfobacula toluolica Tol2]|uniref:DUF4410 domain-containing protein n=2 Tax=Desulfobacula TaxID=28222 RepID=K0NSL2_DESTT|nr:uncharacterized protein TOL2_C38310 [Desulfobacula toluolica Tol2]